MKDSNATENCAINGILKKLRSIVIREELMRTVGHQTHVIPGIQREKGLSDARIYEGRFPFDVELLIHLLTTTILLILFIIKLLKAVIQTIKFYFTFVGNAMLDLFRSSIIW